MDRLHIKFGVQNDFNEFHLSSVLNSICIGHIFGLLKFIPIVTFSWSSYGIRKVWRKFQVWENRSLRERGGMTAKLESEVIWSMHFSLEEVEQLVTGKKCSPWEVWRQTVVNTSTVKHAKTAWFTTKIHVFNTIYWKCTFMVACLFKAFVCLHHSIPTSTAFFLKFSEVARLSAW